MNDVARMALEESISRAGGVVSLAKKVGAKQARVSNWRSRGRVPVEPENYCLLVEKETGVPKERLRPDIYVN